MLIAAKPLSEKFCYPGEASFLATVSHSPHFNTTWHEHTEFELVYFLAGSGNARVGNYIGEFETGDIFLLGSRLAHAFRASGPDETIRAVTIHFREDSFGRDFFQLPESRRVRRLLHIAQRGIRFRPGGNHKLQESITSLPVCRGFQGILQLGNCLHWMSEADHYHTLSTTEISYFLPDNMERMDQVFRFTLENFRDNIQLPHIARMAGMSVPAFCNYFKKRTRKTYIGFVNELRIGHACKLLSDPQKTISEICYESGYNSVANFNKQFLKVKGEAPSHYKKKLSYMAGCLMLFIMQHGYCGDLLA